MLSQPKAQAIVQLALPGAVIKTWADYNDLYLFRVEYPSLAERNWDPFWSVDKNTGEARDFSVITDGNLSDITKLKWTEL